MQFVKGMRDKLQKYLDENCKFDVCIEISGKSVYDCCCFGVDANGKLSDENYMIFYNQTSSPSGEITFSNDSNQTIFHVDLQKLPSSIQKLVFTISIDGSETMSDMNTYKLSVLQNAEEVITVIGTKAEFTKEKAIISAEIYRKDVWRFASVSNGFNGGLSALLKFFGGEEDKDTTPVIEETQQIPRSEVELVQHQTIKYGKPIRNENEQKPLCSSETFNEKNQGGESTKIGFKYNPYTVESIITIDGKEAEAPNRLFDLKNERIQVWIDQLLPILIELCNDSSFTIDFYGLRLDYDDLYEIIRDYCEEHKDIEVKINFTEARGSDDRIEELQRLFAEMQKECPFEDLKTKQIQENFKNAISSEDRKSTRLNSSH